jgi:gamma-glutamylcyclotransferase
MIYYFAYGSNLHPIRLQQRVASAELVGTAIYTGHCLKFHKRSHDGSGKCNMWYSASESDQVFGAIYRMDAAHKLDLDRFEGKGHGYIDQQISVSHAGKTWSCFTYLAQSEYIQQNLKPYRWYRDLVLQGAIYLGFPAAYIATIQAVDTIADPDPLRNSANEALLRQMKQIG